MSPKVRAVIKFAGTGRPETPAQLLSLLEAAQQVGKLFKEIERGRNCFFSYFFEKAH